MTKKMSHPSISDAANSPNNTHYSHNTDSFNYNVWNLNMKRLGEDNERSEILTWLSSIEPRIRHQDIRTRRADKVGEWLLGTDKFQRWYAGDQQGGSKHAALFCYGDPAVGKTYFSSLVVDGLCDMAGDQNIAVACFYVDFAAREEQSPTNVLGSLLKQIVSGLERIPEEIGRTFQEYKKVIGGRGLRVPEIVRMLQTATSSQPTFICIDALDECAEGHRPEVLDSLRKILEKSPSTRIFLTGRRHIHGEIERHLGGRVATLAMKPNDDDIVGYIRMRLDKDSSRDAMDNGLEDEIIKTITKDIPETFLLISLTMDAILGETTAYGRRQKLRAVTDGLDLKGVYGSTLERIKEQGGEKKRLGMAALMWISHSERLLQLNELSHALAVEMGSTDFNPEKIPSVETLLSSCLGLVVVDREVSTVRLIHFTLQEYIYTCPELSGAAHAIMAKTCLTYLNFRTINEISPTRVALPQSIAFLNYSSIYWGAHARRQASRDVVSLALKLFSQIENHISTRLLLAHLTLRTGRYSGDIPTNGRLVGFTGLHCASVFGIVDIATALMGRPNCNPNKSDFLGITPLIWATICGQEQVVKLLLEHRTTISDKPDNWFRRTPLSWAAFKGHEGIARLFLGLGSAKPDLTERRWGKSPRLVNVVLRRRYVNPNSLDKYGQTPISLAAEEGHEGVVKVLLGRKDVKPDVTDGYGHTALFWACSRGHEGVVKLLVESGDVSIDIMKKDVQALLLSAVESGYEGVAGLLFGLTDINPNMCSNDGQTLLSLAAQNGHDAVVKLLFGLEDLEPDMRDKSGRTPLSWAAGNGCEGAVKLLLGRGDVNPSIRCNFGQTPLSWSAGNGREEVVKLLLGRGDVSPDMTDHNGRTPLSWSAGNGREGVVKLLLGRGDVSPDTTDHNGRTPLSFAAENGHEGVVKLLLGRENVNSDLLDSYSQTPLSWAAEMGHDGIVKLLLGRENVNPNMRTKDGRTPLSWAAGNGHERVVDLLLVREDVNPNTPCSCGKTPLSWAARNGHDGVAKLLLGREDVNQNIPDKSGKSPLSWAAMNGHESTLKLLQAHK